MKADIFELLKRDQNGTSDYVESFLNENHILYERDSYGNIFYLDHENAPLLSAHMDTVRNAEDFCLSTLLEDTDPDKISSGGILGGDDKCGVFIILEVLASGAKVNFILSRDEEIGCVGIKKLLSEKHEEVCEKVRKCLWCLVLDRRGNSDIICVKNNYGTKEFEDAIKKVSDEHGFGYKPQTGLCSDANTIRNFVSCANISTGYFSPHSSNEYIVKADLQKALDYTFAVINEVKDHFNPCEQKSYYDWGGSYYSNYYNYYDDEDYYDYTWGDYTSPASKYLSDNHESNKWLLSLPGDEYEAAEAKSCSCDFCGFATNGLEPLRSFAMPDGKLFMICDLCLGDMRREVMRLSSEI